MSILRSILLLPFLIILGCPKKSLESIEEEEREVRVRELIGLEEDDLDDLPESEDKEEENPG